MGYGYGGINGCTGKYFLFYGGPDEQLRIMYSGPKSHDPCFHKKYMEAGGVNFVAHCTPIYEYERRYALITKEKFRLNESSYDTNSIKFSIFNLPFFCRKKLPPEFKNPHKF